MLQRGSQEQKKKFDEIIVEALEEWTPLHAKYPGGPSRHEAKKNGRHAAIHDFCVGIRDKMRRDKAWGGSAATPVATKVVASIKTICDRLKERERTGGAPLQRPGRQPAAQTERPVRMRWAAADEGSSEEEYVAAEEGSPEDEDEDEAIAVEAAVPAETPVGGPKRRPRI